MRLLIVDSAPRAEDLAASLLQSESCDVTRHDLSSAPVGDPIELPYADRDVALVHRSTLAEHPALLPWLVHARAQGLAVLLLIDHIADLTDERPSPDQAAEQAAHINDAIDDFALASAEPRELLVRAQRARAQRQDHLTQLQEMADASARRAFASKVLRAQEAERHLLSRELHDGIGQMVLCHLMDADYLAAQVGDGPARELADQLCKSLGVTLGIVRDLAMDLRPPAIDELGIAATLESLVSTLDRRSDVRLQFRADPIRPRLPADVEVVLYRIAQAALDNAMRHARAENIQVALERATSGLQLTVIDDGIGFDLKREGGSTWLGLVGMRERANAIGGHVTIDSTIDRGTIVTVVVPEILELPRE